MVSGIRLAITKFSKKKHNKLNKNLPKLTANCLKSHTLRFQRGARKSRKSQIRWSLTDTHEHGVARHAGSTLRLRSALTDRH